MFVSCHNTYIAVDEGALYLAFLADYYEASPPKPAEEYDIEQAGYEVSALTTTRYIFKVSEKGYLSASPDLSLKHNRELDRQERFRKIDPEILPPALPVFEESEGIDHNIHQIGIFPEDPGVYPDIYIKNRNKIVALNPDFKMYFWSEGGFYDIKEFIEETYGKEFSSYYDAINPDYPAARADLFRYMCLYAMGGVYCDLKTSLSYPLQKVIRSTDRFLVSFWYHNGWPHPEVAHIPYNEYEQYYIICRAGHPAMRRMIQQVLCNIKLYKPNINGVGMFGTLRLAGPLIYSPMIHEYRKKHPDAIRRIHSVSNGIEYTIFEDNLAHRENVGTKKHYTEEKEPVVNELKVIMR